MTDERNPSNDVLDVIARALYADDWDEGGDDYANEARFYLANAAAVLDALSAAGFVVLRVPQGDLQHGDELEPMADPECDACGGSGVATTEGNQQ